MIAPSNPRAGMSDNRLQDEAIIELGRLGWTPVELHKVIHKLRAIKHKPQAILDAQRHEHAQPTQGKTTGAPVDFAAAFREGQRKAAKLRRQQVRDTARRVRDKDRRHAHAHAQAHGKPGAAFDHSTVRAGIGIGWRERIARLEAFALLVASHDPDGPIGSLDQFLRLKATSSLCNVLEHYPA